VREEQRNLIQRMATQDRAAGHEFVNIWDERIRSWVYYAATYEKVDEYTQADCIRYGGDCRVINDQDGLEESL
jgi:hypothetical protein